MIISVASGKGGTGKTTVTSSLSRVWDRELVVVDLDVEEPNLHLFLKVQDMAEENVSMDVPTLDEARCTSCGACTEACQFKAIVQMGKAVLTFPEMCHGCGGCFAVCPEHALNHGGRVLGTVVRGSLTDQTFLMGRLRVGEAMSPPLMRAVKSRLNKELASGNKDALVDSPPGVSCPAMNAVMDSDVILLVAEPTPFGFHDFALAWEAFAPLNIPMGVVINRGGTHDRSVHAFCRDKGLPLLAEIPDDREIAECYSRGIVPVGAVPGLGGTFTNIMREARHLAGEPDDA